MCVLYWHKWLLFLTQSLSTLSVLPEKHRNVESTSDDTQLFCKVVQVGYLFLYFSQRQNVEKLINKSVFGQCNQPPM